MKTLLKNGTIYDGSGAAPVTGSVLLEDDRIVAVGVEADGCEADQVIDCTGLCIAPGFIDGHSHNDMFYDYDDTAKYYVPFIEQGITTQITGNCGFSPFGVPEGNAHAADVGSGLFASKHPGTFAAFKERAKGNLYINMAPLVGHSSTRIGVKGMSPEPLTKDEIAREMEMVEEAMKGGALGGSFGFMYEPSCYAREDELVAFASKVAEYDGIVTVHPRAESKVAMDYSLLERTPHIELALDEVIRIMEKSKCRMQYSHMIFVGESSWPSLEPMLKKIHDYRDQGYDIAYDHYAMHYGASVITVICPAWYLALPKEKRKSAWNRFRLKLMIDITKKVLGIDYCDLRVAYINDEPRYKAFEGRDVAEIARSEGKSCFDLYMELVDASNGKGGIFLGRYLNDDILKRLMQDDLSTFITDAWLEAKGYQNGAAFQCYPAFLVKGKAFGIPEEQTIRKMTGAIADRFRLKDRGYLKTGYKADVTVYDPRALKLYPDEPGRKADGISMVFMNGQPVLKDGTAIPRTCGELILRA